jgi:hypothetical protein
MLPILITAFNRRDHLVACLQSIVTQPHGDIYISADGPRIEYPNECKDTHAYITELAREGIVKSYRLSEINLGLMNSMHAGIDWFFRHTNEGLILEDDLIINPPALVEAEICFQYLRSNANIGSISMTNSVPISKLKHPKETARLASTFDSHGWGTTAEKWSKNRKSFLNREDWFPWKTMKQKLGIWKTVHIFLDLKIDRANESLDVRKCSFAWRWALTHYENNWHVLIPTINRIGYLGVGEDATNTKRRDYPSPDPNLSAPQFSRIEIVREDAGSDRFFYIDYGLIQLVRTRLSIRTRLMSIRNFFFKFVAIEKYTK